MKDDITIISDDKINGFKKTVQQIADSLKKILDIKDTPKGNHIKNLCLIVHPCTDRLEGYDLFEVQNVEYNKIMGHNSSYSLYLDEDIKTDNEKTNSRKLVASFRLMEFPGCCGMALSTQALVYPEYRCKGIGTILNKLRIEIARYNDYTVLVCTAVDDEVMPKILLRNGWSETLGFTNKRTGNHVILYSIYL